jgi:hypothetical protein
MKSRVILTCLGFLLGSIAFAQTTPSSEPQQPAASAQVQSETQATTEAPKDSEKKDDSDHNRRLHVRFGGVSLAAAYASGPFFWGPFWPYSFYPYSYAYSPFFYDPFFYSSFYGPYAGGFSYGPDKGEIKLRSNPKNAQVFVDGAYAGTADHLKNMWLDSGAYDLSVSAPGREPFHQRIYVLSGKSLKIDAKLGPEKNPKHQMQEKP